MSTRTKALAKTQSTPVTAPVRDGLLQRKPLSWQPPLIQAKRTPGEPLTVGQPDDEYEQEADRVADQVMRMPEPGIQRQAATEGEDRDGEQALQPKQLASQITPLVQRQAWDEEEEAEEEQVQDGPQAPLPGREPLGAAGRPEPIESQAPGSSTLDVEPTRDADELGQEQWSPTEAAEEPGDVGEQEEEPGGVTEQEERQVEEEGPGGMTVQEEEPGGVTEQEERQVEEEEPGGVTAQEEEPGGVTEQEERPVEEEEPGGVTAQEEEPGGVTEQEERPVEEEGPGGVTVQEEEPGGVTEQEERQVEEEEPVWEEEEEEEAIQAKSTRGPTPRVGPGLAAQIRSLRGGGRPLSQAERGFFEPRFGYDFSHVRIHSNGRAAGLSGALHARAFTHGRDIVLGSGRYGSGLDQGKRLLAHELAHVVQQGSKVRHVQLQESSERPRRRSRRRPLMWYYRNRPINDQIVRRTQQYRYLTRVLGASDREALIACHLQHVDISSNDPRRWRHISHYLPLARSWIATTLRRGKRRPKKPDRPSAMPSRRKLPPNSMDWITADRTWLDRNVKRHLRRLTGSTTYKIVKPVVQGGLLVSKILSLGTGFFARLPPVAPLTVMIGAARELAYAHAYRGYVAYALGLAYGHVSMAMGQWDKLNSGWEHPMVAKRGTDWSTGMRQAAAYYTRLARRGSDGSQMARRKLRAIRRLGPNVALNIIWRKVITQVGLKGRQLRRWKAYKLHWPEGYDK